MDLSGKDIETIRGAKHIVIIGLPASGKTFVSDVLRQTILPKYHFYHTDDYMDFGYEGSLYAMMKEISYNKDPHKVIEGVQGYRYLRKLLENKDYSVDLVIEVESDGAERQDRYYQRGKGDLPRGFENNLRKVYKDYLDLLVLLPEGVAPPKFLTIKS
jgi:hypothetical protein